MTAKPYDPTLKALVETEPESWPVLLGRPAAPTAAIDADIATVSGAADKVLRVSADPPYLLHLEFVAGHDAGTLPRKLHIRNGLLHVRQQKTGEPLQLPIFPELTKDQMAEVVREIGNGLALSS